MSWRVVGSIVLGALVASLVGFASNNCAHVLPPILRVKLQGQAPEAASTKEGTETSDRESAQATLATPATQATTIAPAVVKTEWPPQHRHNGTMVRQPWVSAGQEDPCIPRAHNLSPRGDYEYHSSKLEKEWSDGERYGKICETAGKHSAKAAIWTKYTAAIYKTHRQPQREPTEEEAHVLSYFIYPQPDGSRVKRYIEPLHGVGRHPHSTCGGASLWDLKYLLPENACTEGGTNVRGVFFDMGAGITLDGFEDFDYARGNGAGGSIPLFYRMYYDRCIDFHAIYAWEVRGIDHRNFWRPMPDHIRSRVRIYNTPVIENDCPHSPQGNFTERGSFLRLLKSSVTADDYVVVKVDIDGGPELAIVESIAHLPELSDLVDEMYFEYHFNFDNQPHPWGRGTFGGKNVDTAINLMLRLRQAGIRAHFWI